MVESNHSSSGLQKMKENMKYDLMLLTINLFMINNKRSNPYAGESEIR